MEFNIGDTVTCIKDFIEPKWLSNYGYPGSRKIYLKNKDYKITFADYWDELNGVIVYKINDVWNFYVFEKEYNLSWVQSITRLESVPKFNEYFCSKKNLRKDKINKINNNGKNK